LSLPKSRSERTDDVARQGSDAQQCLRAGGCAVRDFLFRDADEKYVPEALAYIHSYDVKLKQIPTEIATQRARVKK
jgi:hypothetical protein